MFCSQEIIDRYGLGSRRFTEHEKYDPRTDPKMEVKHPSETNPFYWRKLRAVHPILEADPASKSMGIMTMMMTHPGLPAYLPVRVYFYFYFYLRTVRAIIMMTSCFVLLTGEQKTRR